MTGNTTTVMIGLALLIPVLPLGLLVLFRTNTTIEREHPFDLGPTPLPQQRSAMEIPAAEIPEQRPATAAETPEPRTTADAGSVPTG